MGTQYYECHSIDIHNRLLLSAIGIKIQRNPIQGEVQAFLGREACTCHEPPFSTAREPGGVVLSVFGMLPSDPARPNPWPAEHQRQRPRIPISVGTLPTPFIWVARSLRCLQWARMPSTLLTLQPIPHPGTAWKSMQYPKDSVPSSCEGREQEEEPKNRGEVRGNRAEKGVRVGEREQPQPWIKRERWDGK